MPQTLAQAVFEARIVDLEAFWDSEMHRAGEHSAIGWASWAANGRPTQIEPTSSRRNVTPTPASDPYSAWATSEIMNDRAHPYSSRSTDQDDDGSDPYATVLFSDVQPLLVSSRSQRSKQVFRLIWLSFLGLHIPGFVASLSNSREGNMDDRWASTGLVSPTIFPADSSVASRRITAVAQAGVLIGREREYRSGFGPVREWGYQAVGPFDGFGSANWTIWSPSDVAQVDVDAVREVFRSCRYGDETEWDILNLAFEAALSVKG